MPRPKVASDDSYIDDIIIGIRAIDQQHAHLIELYNDLVTQIKGAKNSKVILSPFIAEVFSYTDYHFRTEETLMRAVAYPNLTVHCKEHRLFFYRFDELSGRLAEERAPLEELTVMLREWITSHMTTFDRHFANYYNQVKASRNET